MISEQHLEKARKRTLEFFANAGIFLTPAEKNNIEIAEFGLGRLNEIGLQLVTYINTDRVCAKELVLFPGQICPEHAHPPIKGGAGKEETFLCRWGTVYLYVPGPATPFPHGTPPEDIRRFFTVWHEIVLNPGEQYTLEPNTLHWFQGGEKGAIVSEFSTTSTDEADVFTDPTIVRIP